MATITAELTAGTIATISNGRHTWRADEPPEAGGTDTGPTPYEMLVGSLAGCTCITLSLDARHKGVALKSVSASYKLDRIHAHDCEDCDEREDGYVDRIESSVRLAGDFDDAQRKRLEQIVSRCPVHKTLDKGMHIVDRVEFA